MSDEVESLRREIGEKAARDGEALHANASESAKEGYRRGFLGFGSNIMPPKFGKGADTRQPWICVCGHENKRYLNNCWMCNLSKEAAIEANLEENE